MVDVMAQVLLMHAPAAFTATTFDGFNTNVTLSNGDLTATNTSSADGGWAKSRSLQSTGKYYFEVVATDIQVSDDSLGIMYENGKLNDIILTSDNGAFLYTNSGNIYVNGADTTLTVGSGADGDRYGVAVDFTNDKIWFRRNNGNWNGQVIGSQDPAGNVGGVSISDRGSLRASPFVGFGTLVTGQNSTANFGNTAFTDTAPSGFTSGWPAWDGVSEWLVAWQTPGVTTSSNTWNGFTLRTRIYHGFLCNKGTQVRVTIQGGATEGAAGDACYVGHAAVAGDAYDAESLTQVQFSASNSFDTGVNGILLSDATTATLDGRRYFLVTAHFNNTAKDNVRSTGSLGSQANSYFKTAVSEAGTLNVTGYSVTSGSAHLLTKIEVFG